MTKAQLNNDYYYHQMKSLLLLLIISQVYVVLFGQTEQKYLVFTFDRRYYVEKQQGFMGSGDNVWIVPFDSCKTRLKENDMNPLFVTEDLLFELEDITWSEVGTGNFFVVEYPQIDSTAWLLYKNRTKIQERTIKYAHIESKDVLTIYFVPIIAKCHTHPFGYYKNTVVTIDGTPAVWSDFWKEDEQLLRSLLCHDFSDFDYIVSLEERTKGKKKNERCLIDPIVPSKAIQTVTDVNEYGPSKGEFEDSDVVFTTVEEAPEFPGGEQALTEFFRKNLRYPFGPEDCITGRVTLSFIVEKDGSITDIQELRSPDPRATAEVIRVISLMPKWKPGKQHGQNVRVKYVLPFTFRI